MRSLALALGLVIASSAAVATAWLRGEAAPESLHLTATVDSNGLARVRLDGLEQRLISRLSERVVTPEGWEKLLSLSVGQSGISVAAEYHVSRNRLELVTVYPLLPGLSYTAVANPRSLYLAAGVEPHGELSSISKSLLIPAVPSAPLATVVEIYPTADVVPENLLKFYVEFSHPMREGDAAGAITLLDDMGKPVPSAFLGIETELWDPSHRRLTVYLDPGRIKRGLRPNQELGPPLVAGRRYRLRISAKLRDADGANLLHSFEKRFTAGPADRSQLSAARVNVSAPRAGSSAPMVVTMPEVLDFALARRMIWLEDPDGTQMQVTVSLADHERQVLLTPKLPWMPGLYTVVIDGRLEDLAGNTFQRPFDADLNDSTVALRDDLATVRLTVRIGAATS